MVKKSMPDLFLTVVSGSESIRDAIDISVELIEKLVSVANAVASEEEDLRSEIARLQNEIERITSDALYSKQVFFGAPDRANPRLIDRQSAGFILDWYRENDNFGAKLVGLFRKADPVNIGKLRQVYPGIYHALLAFDEAPTASDFFERYVYGSE